jgi:hypothetical protein
MVGAAMGRYTGEDYWRGQYRGARGLREQGLDTIMGISGMQIPPELQAARQLRNLREARQDFSRNQARQMEHDLRSIGAGDQTVRNIAATPGINMREFMQSEGGRNLVMQILQQNQGAYARRGIDVSGEIIGLQGEQQAFAGRKLATEMGIRGRQGHSIEAQIADMKKTLQNPRLDTESRQKAQVELAEKYAEASKHFLSVGELGKAEKYSQAQENILRDVPKILQREFKDAQARSLFQLTEHTRLLKIIAGEVPTTPQVKGGGTGGGAGGGGTTPAEVIGTPRGYQTPSPASYFAHYYNSEDPTNIRYEPSLGVHAKRNLIAMATARRTAEPTGYKGLYPLAQEAFGASAEVAQYQKEEKNNPQGVPRGYYAPASSSYFSRYYNPENIEQVRYSGSLGVHTRRNLIGMATAPQTSEPQGYSGLYPLGGSGPGGFNIAPETKFVPSIPSDAEYEKIKEEEQADDSSGAFMGRAMSRLDLMDLKPTPMLDSLAKDHDKRTSRSEIAKKLGLREQVTKFGGARGVGAQTDFIDFSGRAYSVDDIDKAMQKGSADDYLSGVTSSPDSMRSEQKPEDKQKSAAEMQLEAARIQKETAAKGFTINWPGGTAQVGGAGSYPT